MPRQMIDTLRAIVQYMRAGQKTDTVKYALLKESITLHAGMSELSVKRYIALMLELGILRPASPLTYFFDKRAFEKLTARREE